MSTNENAEFLGVSYSSELSKDFTLDTFATMVMKAARFNFDRLIGGCIQVDQSRKFCTQYFEGSTEEASALWSKVENDPRHRIIEFKKIFLTERTIRVWGMEWKNNPHRSVNKAAKVALRSDANLARSPEGAIRSIESNAQTRKTGRELAERDLIPTESRTKEDL